MKKLDFCKLLGDVDESYVAEAHAPRKSSAAWVKWAAAAAACVCLALGGVLLWKRPAEPTPPTPSAPTVTEQGITLPLPEVQKPEDGTAADMIAFFIYQNRWYEWYDELPDEALVGEYVGTSDGSIDEWTTEDGYVDFAGSVFGDFYTVKGYAPDTMLCLWDGGYCPEGLYFCSKGLTLGRGSELYTDRLRLSAHTALSYETRQSWYYTENEVKTYAGAETAVQDFVTALNEGSFMRTADIPLEGRELYDDMEVYHLYFTMPDGIDVHLRLFEGGYVMMQNLRDVCIRVPQEVFDALLAELA